LPLFALLFANAVSTTGNALTFVAIPWFVLETTGSAARTGLAGGVAFLAAVLAGLFGGPIVDRLGFGRTSVLADLASCASVAAIPLIHNTVGLAFWQLLALVFLGGVLDAPGTAARQSLIPQLSRRAGVGMERANSAFQGAVRLSTLVGPPIGGLLIAALGASNVLLVDAATFAVSAALVALLVPPAATSPAEKAGDREGGGYLAELAEGLRFVRRTRVVFAVVAGGVALNFFAEPVYVVILPVYAEEIFGSAPAFGFLLGGFGGGALAGTVLFGALGRRLPRQATLVVAVALSAVPFLALAASPPLPVGVALMFVQGLGVGAINPLVFTVVQERAPERLLGRVFGALFALAEGAAPLGIVLAGYALEGLGLRPVLLAVAAGLSAVAAYALLNPAFREMEKPAASTAE
jgi:MFS family permease